MPWKVRLPMMCRLAFEILAAVQAIPSGACCQRPTECRRRWR
jgi:hypothetical protein